MDTSKIKTIESQWVNYDQDQKITAASQILEVLANKEGIKQQNLKIVRLGPPSAKGFYDIKDDTIYLNDYLLNGKFEKILESISHLFSYKLHMLDAIKNNKNDEKQNFEKYIYPWNETDLEGKDLYWISLVGLKDSSQTLDWKKIDKICK